VSGNLKNSYIINYVKHNLAKEMDIIESSTLRVWKERNFMFTRSIKLNISK